MFLYLCGIVPAIWLLELKTNRREMLCLYVEMLDWNNSGADSPKGGRKEDDLRSSILLDIMQVSQKMVFYAKKSFPPSFNIFEQNREHIFPTYIVLNVFVSNARCPRAPKAY